VTNINAIVVNRNGAFPAVHPLTLNTLQATVGGYIELLFIVPSPFDGYPRCLTGYCCEELDPDALPTLTTVDVDGNKSVARGPVVIAGLDASTGQTVPLTADEIARVLGDLVPLIGINRSDSTAEPVRLFGLSFYCED
jgi:hypothetical protein